MRKFIGFVICPILLVGCAGIYSKQVTPTSDKEDTGFRYYETSPFLLVHADGKGGLESKLLYLPDTTKMRSIKPYNFGAKNDVTLKFDRGRLVQAKAVVDETIIPNAVVSALEKVAIANIKAGNGDAPGIPAPILYRIIADDKGVWKLEGEPATDINGAPVIIKFTP